jgi:hypothetical protein
MTVRAGEARSNADPNAPAASAHQPGRLGEAIEDFMREPR